MLAIGLRSTLVSLAVAGFSLACVADESPSASIDLGSGLQIDAEENWKLVKANCASCHSGRLLAQHSMSREAWLKSIRRMQSEENLWDLGDTEAAILDYLSEIYGPTEGESTRRIRRPLLNQTPVESDSEAVQNEPTPTESEATVEAEESKPPPLPDNP